jgi:phage tail sheath protein FI
MARTILSPGIEIREKDLSLRVQTQIGTTIAIPGFASQGPLGDPIQVTSISEFESIFGIPNTPAERYFYYSVKEALNSQAVIFVVRLPYGGENGYTNSYSGLFYPMTPTLSTTNTGEDGPQTGWTILEPENVTINLDIYTKLTRGDFTWRDTNLGLTLSATSAGLSATRLSTAAPALYVDPNGTINLNAGFYIVNKLQASINEIGEGYYVGISTNAEVDDTSPNFDSVKRMTSLRAISGSGRYFDIPSTRLDFALSATKFQSDNGLQSISETLEKPGFQAYESDDYMDHLAFGVYKIGRSLSDASLLSLNQQTRYLGSLDETRKITNMSGGVLQNAFIEDLVNSNSSSVVVTVNPAISRYKWSDGSTGPTQRVQVSEAAKSLFPAGVYAPNTILLDQAKQIGNIPLKLQRALIPLENAETFTVDAVVDAGLSTIYANVTQYFNDGLGHYNDESGMEPDGTTNIGGFEQGTVAENWNAVANVLENFASGSRKDCIAIIDPLRSIFIKGKDTKTLDLTQYNFTQHMYLPLKNTLGKMDSNYCVSYATWVKVNDIFSSRKFWSPFSGYAAGVIARSDANGNPWDAVAGFSRGNFSNVLDIGFNPGQKLRDRLYELGVNPVIFFSGDGYAIYGQKTLQNKPTAFDRLNVRRLFLSLERSVATTMRSFVFEPNTTFVRNKIVSTLSPAFEYAKNTNGLYDFLIVCDERNNSPSTIDNGELVVDIYLKPVRSAEFLLVNFIATRTGQTFSELI